MRKTEKGREGAGKKGNYTRMKERERLKLLPPRFKQFSASAFQVAGIAGSRHHALLIFRDGLGPKLASAHRLGVTRLGAQSCSLSRSQFLVTP